LHGNKGDVSSDNHDVGTRGWLNSLGDFMLEVQEVWRSKGEDKRVVVAQLIRR